MFFFFVFFVRPEKNRSSYIFNVKIETHLGEYEIYFTYTKDNLKALILIYCRQLWILSNQIYGIEKVKAVSFLHVILINSRDETK